MKLGAIVLDSNNSDEWASFYQKLLGWKKTRYDDEWIIVSSENGEGTPLVFQENKNYKKPIWPSTSGEQQQMIHLDFYVDHVEEAIKHALSCGAQVSEVQLSNDWQVLLDPAGHPFCILPSTSPAKK